jgi:hypothetical protein
MDGSVCVTLPTFANAGLGGLRIMLQRNIFLLMRRH